MAEMIENGSQDDGPRDAGVEDGRTADTAPARRSAVGAGAAPVRSTPRAKPAKAPAQASRTLPVARQAFVDAIARDTPGSDLPRLVAVLDALVAWSVARPALLAFRGDEKRADVLAFELAGTSTVFWAARAARGAGPTLEITPPASSATAVEDRAAAMQTLNEHSRAVLVDGDRLRITFGALKNEVARAAVFAMMKRLLDPPAPTSSTAPAAPAAPAAPPAGDPDTQ